MNHNQRDVEWAPSKLRLDKSWTPWSKRHNGNWFHDYGMNWLLNCFKDVQRCKDVQSTKGSPGASIFRVSWSTMQKRNGDSLLLSCVMCFGLLEQSGLGTSVFCLAFHSWNQESSWRFDVHAGYSGGSCVQPGFSLRRAESSSSLGSLWMSSNEERRNWLANKTVGSNKFKREQEDTKHQK